ncbi:MAG: diguanylate cyclase [Thermodesulfobacteriota bacterium]
MKPSKGPEETAELLDKMVGFLGAVVDDRRAPGDPPPSLAGHQEFLELGQKLLELRNFVLAIANGNLDFRVTSRGYLSGALKTLQAHLRHLTWQAQRVASGDYSQRVDFMGEFSEAFNAMVEKLDATVRALRESEARYREMAITDPLTGLHNRRHFFSLAQKEMARALRYGLQIACIMLDLDHFKAVNDTHGHDAGDRVLAMTAHLLKNSLRSVDIAARYGGEEFVVLLPESGRAGAMILAERIRRDLAASQVTINGKNISVTASLGVSHQAPDGEKTANMQHKVEDLVKAADEALYKAKKAGRNQVQNS